MVTGLKYICNISAGKDNTDWNTARKPLCACEFVEFPSLSAENVNGDVARVDQPPVGAVLPRSLPRCGRS